MQHHFNSFSHAVEIASISRCYGGIHYHMRVNQGVIAGEKLGMFIVEKVLK